MAPGTTAFHGVPDCVGGYAIDNNALDQNRPDRPVHQAALCMLSCSCAVRKSGVNKRALQMSSSENRLDLSVRLVVTAITAAMRWNGTVWNGVELSAYIL